VTLAVTGNTIFAVEIVWRHRAARNPVASNIAVMEIDGTYGG
jgi:hypothetical protein